MNGFRTAALGRVLKDQRGLTTVEYAILLCLIAAFAVGTWQKLGSNIQEHLFKANGDIKDQLNVKPTTQ